MQTRVIVSALSLLGFVCVACAGDSDATNSAPRMRIISEGWGATETHDRAVVGIVQNISGMTLTHCVVRVKFYDEGGALVKDRPASTKSLDAGEKWKFVVPAPDTARSFKVQQPMAKK